MRLTSVEPGGVRRVFGYFTGVVALAILLAVVIYFSGHIASLSDILAILLGGFVSLLGALLLSLALFLSASSIVARRVGCILAIVFGAPFTLLFVFLVWSLFQTTRPAGHVPRQQGFNSTLQLLQRALPSVPLGS